MKTNRKQGTKVTQVTSSEARTAATQGSRVPGLRAEKRDELHDHDQRTGGGLGQGEAATISPGASHP